ncbi:MAG: DUF4174 domain-containing protein [Roseobacter sp.]
MKPLLAVVITVFFTNSLLAQSAVDSADEQVFFSMNEVDLTQFKWKKRPVVVFADSELDPAFLEQMELLQARPDELIARDIVVITDTSPDPLSNLRRKLRPRNFMLVLMSKDGTVNVRKPFPWDVREISRSVDKMPTRKREIRERKQRATDR